MSEITLPPYRHVYPDKRLAKAYALFVDGAANLRAAAERTEAGFRTLCRYSTRDGWVSERDVRTGLKTEQNVTTRLMASAEAAMAAESDLRRQLADNPNQRTLILSVLKRHQKFWDRLETQVTEALEEVEREAAAKSKPIPLGKLFPIVKLAETVAANVRKAYGIPDVSKIEWEDTTPAAQRHADSIRARRAKRIAERAAAGGTIN